MYCVECGALPSAQTGGNDKRKQKIIIVILMMPSGRQSYTGYVEVYEGSYQDVLFLSSHHSLVLSTRNLSGSLRRPRYFCWIATIFCRDRSMENFNCVKQLDISNPRILLN